MRIPVVLALALVAIPNAPAQPTPDLDASSYLDAALPQLQCADGDTHRDVVRDLGAGYTLHAHADCPAAFDEAADAMTDCSATAFKKIGWVQPTAYNAFLFSAGSFSNGWWDYYGAIYRGGREWDYHTAATISGQFLNMQSYNTANGLNNYPGNIITQRQVGTPLAVASVIALAGVAIDSDIFFDTDHPFDPNVVSFAYDVQSVAAHEFGHVYGLDHVPPSCLTMHFAVAMGDGSKRTMGDGDILGIRALYGA